MNAARYTRYGPPAVVSVVHVADPVPGPDEVIVDVRAVAVTSADARIRAARFPEGFGILARMVFGVFRPRLRVLGSTFSGVVAKVGAEVSDIRVGDEVCGMTGRRMGAHAEQVAVARRRVTAKPAAVSHDQAAGVLFGGTAALWFLRDRGGVTAGSRVLIVGAAGAVGSNAVQLAALAGAQVSAVTSSANATLVRELGAHRIIDRERVDFAGLAGQFDVVFDTVGLVSVGSGRRLLAPGGVLLLAVAGLADTLRARGAVVAGSAPERVADFDELLGMVADGSLRVVIDGVYTLGQIVDAHRRVDTGAKVGNILIRP